jgi:single-strand DNA-binding protein
MASYNRVILLGNLTRDPQLRYLPNQTPVVDFGIAVNRKYKTQSGEAREEVMFVDCSAFARTAEIINQYCRKGNLLHVEGRLRFDQWEDKQGGGKRSKHTVLVDNVQLMPRGEGGGPPAVEGQEAPGQRAVPRAPQAAGAQQGAAAAPPEQPFPNEQQIKEDDIPF